MIGTIRKHSSWLWVVIIVVTIFTFVYWGSQSPQMDERGGGNFGSIDGTRISKEEFFQTQREAYFRYFLTYGAFPESGVKTTFDPEREVYQRLFFVRKLKEHQIGIDSRSVAQAVNDLLRDLGQGRPVAFDAFVQQYLLPHGINARDVERFVRHELGIQQLVSVIGLSGKLVTPQEAQYLFERDHQEYAAEAVFFIASNYLDRVLVVTEADVAQFYTNQMAAYHVPERAQVSYVAIELSNFTARAEQQLTNLPVLVEDRFRELGTNYLRFGKTPGEVKTKIREQLVRQEALGLAQNQANDFEAELFNMEPEQPSNLATLAKAKGLTVNVTKPFDLENGPSEFDGGPGFAKAAFPLSSERPFPDQPVIGENAIYILAYDKKLPDEILPLNEIRERVAADFKHYQAVMMARRAGGDFVLVATNGIAHGKTFAAVSEEAGARPVTPPRFSISTREVPEVEKHVELTYFKQIVGSTKPRTVSGFNPTAEGGFVVYVQERVGVDPDKMRAELPAFQKLLRRAREQEALNFWLMRESSVSMRNTPLGQRRQASAGPGQAQP